MKEQLISYKTAVLAKEKEFDWPCLNGIHCSHFHFYEEKGMDANIPFHDEFLPKLRNWNDYDDGMFHRLNPQIKKEKIVTYMSLPSQSLLQKWIWIKHHIWVEITLWGDGMGFISIIKQAKGKEDDGSTIVRQISIVETGQNLELRSDPFKLLEKGLFQALKLIKKRGDSLSQTDSNKG